MDHLSSTQELIDRELAHASRRIALALEGPPPHRPGSSAVPAFLLILGVVLAVIAITAPAPWIGAPVAIALGVGGYYGLEDARARRRARRRHLRRAGYLEVGR